jgi:hypothetical protein
VTEEVRANMSFGTLRRGDRLQVDIHDPKVAGLIQGGYLKIIWKGPGDGQMDGAADPDLPGPVSAGSVDSGGKGEPASEEVDDGPGEHQSAGEGGNST